MNTFQIGDKSEGIALSYERVRLGEKESSKFLKDVSGNSSLGYDIESIESSENLTPRYIEVKTLNSRGEIFISSNEVEVLRALGCMAYIYVINLKDNCVEKIIKNPIDDSFYKRAKVVNFSVVF